MKSGLEAIAFRINEYLEDNSEKIVRETIQESGIKKRTGELLSSVKYKGEVSPMVFRIEVGAEYTSYLNDGYEAFDMKPGLMGKTVPIQTPEGLIFRKVTPNSPANSWIHPGMQAALFLEKSQKKLYEGILKIVDNNLTELSPEL